MRTFKQTYRTLRTSFMNAQAATLRRKAVAGIVAGGLTVVLAVDPFGLSPLVPTLEAIPLGAGALSRSERVSAVVGALELPAALPANDVSGAWEPAPAQDDLDVLPTDLPTEEEQTVSLIDAELPEPVPSAVAVELGGMDVVVAPADSVAPEAVTLRVEGESDTEAAGITGVLLQVTDASDVPVATDTEVDLTVSYADFAGIAGGDWASRLRVIWLPACADVGDDCVPVPLETENDPEAETVTATVPVESGGASMANARGSLAVTAAPAGATGNWAATSLSPSATWGGGGSTGGFSWSMPVNVPPVPAGPTPELSLSYSSSGSDGKVPSTNSQSGAIGEGFDITSGYIERSYTPCSDNDTSTSNNEERVGGDLCWGPRNVTLVFNGSAAELIRDGDEWHSKNDDGSRIERIRSSTSVWNGGERDEFWKVTTPDGIQYFFGRGKVSSGSEELNSAWTVPVFGNHADEPCHAAEFEDSRCNQVWRWNLEYVVDPLGNTMTYHYAKETNRYVYDPEHNTNLGPSDKLDTVSYVAGGRLTRIEYGTRKGVSGEAPAKVEFESKPRCITVDNVGDSFCNSSQTDPKSQKWPDTPTDQICDEDDKCTNFSPAFFDRYRLAKIKTSTYDGDTYQPVDSWSFQQQFVAQGTGAGVDHAPGVMLTTTGITHTGHNGTTATSDDITLPENKFTYVFLPNRVDAPNDGQLELFRPRISNIRTESGGSVNVNYRTECGPGDTPKTHNIEPKDNTRLCYPVKWYPNDNDTAVTHYFHKYVVDTMIESGAPPTEGTDSALITGSLEKLTTYTYGGGAAWKKPTGAMVKPKEATYSDFRGFATVTTTVGSGDESTSSTSTYYRGLGGTLTAGPTPQVTVVDHPRFQGQVFSAVEKNGTTLLSQTINKSEAEEVATDEDDEDLSAYRVSSSTSYGYTFKNNGTVEHSTSSTTTFNDYSQVIKIDDFGSGATESDNLCTTVTYAHSDATTYPDFAGNYQVSLPVKTQVVSKECAVTPQLPADLISSDTVTYDALGRTRRTEKINPTTGVGHVLNQEVVEYDPRGRPLQVKNSDGLISTMTYVESDGGLTESMSSTTPAPGGSGSQAGFESTTTFNPLTGLVVKTTDLNDHETTGTYDALGRLLSAKYPQHQSSSTPSVAYEYKISSNGLNSVLTKTLGADGTTQHRSVTLYDGLLRPFQTQVEGVDAGENHNASAASRGRMVSHVYYDTAGNVSKETGQWWAEGIPEGSAVVPVAVPPSLTSYEYDGAGRVTDQVFWVGTDSNPANEKWRTVTGYNGATTLQVPPLGGTPQATTLDARGRTIELREYIRDADTAAANADTVAEVIGLTSQTTKYEYNAAGQRTQMRDTQNNTWSFTYDWGGRQIGAVDPDAGTSSSTYDISGRVVTSVDGSGKKVFYEYDDIGRTIAVRDNNASGSIRATWEYDTTDSTAPGQAAPKVLGQLSSATRYVDGHAYTTSVSMYDDAYRPLGTTVTLPNTPAFEALHDTSFTTNYAYAADGQLASTTLPAVKASNESTVLGREIVTTRYDSASIPSWMSGGFGWGTYVAESRFAADGRPVIADLGNTYGAILSYEYEDGTNRLQRIALDRERFDGTDVNVRYTYDAAGNVTSAKDRPTAAALAGTDQQDNQCFTYDGLRRLESAWTAEDASCATAKGSGSTSNVDGVAPYWTDYAYDPLGNRTAMTEHAVAAGTATSTTYTYGAGTQKPHQLSSISEVSDSTTTTTFNYDQAGNRTTKTVAGAAVSYLWDAEGELTGVDADRNIYDASGNRLIRTDATGTTIYLPGGQEILISEEGVSASRYYAFAGKTVAVRTGSGMGAVSSLVSDHHGTMIASIPNTTWQSNSVKRIFSDPFGAIRGGSDSGAPGDHRFLSAVLDAGNNLSLLGARYYDSAVGQFISVDPMLDPSVPAQFNAYVYSGNNPMTWTDPSGLSWNSFWGNIGAGAKKAWGAVGSFVNKYQAEIVGAVAGGLVFAGCMAATAGAGSIGCAIAGGAVGGAVTNLWKTQVQKTEKFSWKNLATDTLVGGAIGGLTAGAGVVLGAVVKAAAASPAGLAVKSALSSAAKSVTSKLGAATSSATQKIGGSTPGVSAGSAAEGVTLKLSYKQGWSAAQREAADVKVAALNTRAGAGELRTSVAQRGGTSASSRYTRAGNEVPDGSDVDHIIDLQLGGLDEVANMSPLNASVNRSLGSQIMWQTKGLQVGTCIVAVKIC